MPYPLDPVRNGALCTVAAGYNETATTIVLASGHGSKLPQPEVDGAFNLCWWDGMTYGYPGADPHFEIVRCTARGNDILTIIRGQEGTSAQTHNTTGKTYYILLGVTKKMLDDIGTIFAVRNGKSGGQSIYGGINDSESLYFYSTAHSTKAYIFFGANCYLFESSAQLILGAGLVASPLMWIRGTSNARIRFEHTDAPADQKIFHTYVGSGYFQITSINNNLTTRQVCIQALYDGTVWMPYVYDVIVGGTNKDLYIDNTGKLGYVSSSLKRKTKIQNMDLGRLQSIRPVTFEYEDEPGLKQVGFIAEEVQSIIPESVGLDKEGNPVCVNHSKIVPFLVAEIIELRKEIEALKRP